MITTDEETWKIRVEQIPILEYLTAGAVLLIMRQAERDYLTKKEF